MATSGVGVCELPEAHTFDFITSKGESLSSVIDWDVISHYERGRKPE